MENLNLRNIIKPLCVSVLMLLACSLNAQNWNLVWSDEFNGSIGPDWVFEIGTGSNGWGNNELQYYRQQNASIENGQLVITARQENFGGMSYTSARMKTQGRKSWKYGRIEARIAMPSFMGVWPAFWMLGDNISTIGWPACGEIDVMEHVNTENATHGTIHWQDHNGNYANYGGSTPTNVTSYHVYAIEWDANSIKWFLDGNQFHEASIAGGVNGTSEFHENFFILLNMAIGGNWPGFNIDNGAFPAKMYVDYVRVYQSGSGNNGVATLYQHCNYSGYSASLNVGSYTLGQLQALGIQNDDISSLQIQPGYQITMYQHDNFTGNSLVKTGDDNCLVNDGFNDDISSVIVSTVSSGWSTQIEAENWVVQSGTQTEPCSEGGQNVGWIDANDWMVWDVNIPSSGTYNVEYRVASLNGGGQLQLEQAGGSPVFGSLGVPGTGGWQNWTSISHNVNLNGGQQQIAIKALSGGWNLNWLKISSTGGARVANEIYQPETQNVVSIYPNPAKNLLKVSGLAANSNFSIYDLSGKSIGEGKLSGSFQIDLSAFDKGTYVIRFDEGHVFRFVKQ